MGEQKDTVPEKDRLKADDVVFRFRLKGAKKQPRVVQANTIHDGAKRDLLDSIINNTRQKLAAQIHLVPQKPDEPYPHGLPAVVMATPLGKLRGSPQPDEPAKSKYIGVFYDAKLAGEANHRPMQRIPLLRSEPMSRLIELAKGRLGTEVDPENIPEGDVYFLFGGRPGNQAELLKPFQGQTSVNKYLLCRDPGSLSQRLQGDTLSEPLLVVSRSPLAALPTNSHTSLNCTTGESITRPIVFPDFSACWRAMLASDMSREKRNIYESQLDSGWWQAWWGL